MKIKLYFGMENAIMKSGIGRAFYHQKKALTLNNIEFTTDKNDLDYDILHINTIYPDSISMIKQARENNKKIIYHAHSTEEDFKNSFISFGLSKLMSSVTALSCAWYTSSSTISAQVSTHSSHIYTPSGPAISLFT